MTDTLADVIINVFVSVLSNAQVVFSLLFVVLSAVTTLDKKELSF